MSGPNPTAPTLKTTANYDMVFIRPLSRLQEKCVACTSRVIQIIEKSTLHLQSHYPIEIKSFRLNQEYGLGPDRKNTIKTDEINEKFSQR